MDHSKIIDTSETYQWLRRMIHHIQQTCGLNTVQTPTIIYKDNAGCVAQVQSGYVKSNLTKHMSLYFYVTT